MKVTNLEPIILVAPVAEPWRIGIAVYTTMHSVLVRVDTDEGINGYRECLVRFSLEAGAAVIGLGVGKRRNSGVLAAARRQPEEPHRTNQIMDWVKQAQL